MTAANEKHQSLAEAAVSDFTDSAKLDAAWQKHLNGERNLGSGSTGIDLITREETRQEQIMQTFVSNVDENIANTMGQIDEDDDIDTVNAILDRKRSHLPDKVISMDSSSEDEVVPPLHSTPRLSQTRCRSTTTKCFKQV